MNLELIKKHKPQFDWWLEDYKNRKCWVLWHGWSLHSYPFSGWDMAELDNIKAIAIYDEYAKLRKAKAEGKTIQFLTECNGWVDDDTEFCGTISRYRIKPSEWYDDIPKDGVICWVSDSDKTRRDCVNLISNYDNGKHPFMDVSYTRWKYATPVMPEELYSFKEKK